jgi:succinate dehydrogenase (ubiquinone) iron-sulfur subunit
MMRNTSALRALTRAAQQPAMAARAFSSSPATAFAQPAEAEAPAAGKAPKIKEFKIYRWVRS